LRSPVIVECHELGVRVLGVEIKDRVPDVAVPVVGRFAEDSDVHDEGGPDVALPGQPAVRAQDDVGAAGLHAHPVFGLGQGLPPEVVQRQGRAVHEVHVAAVDAQASLRGQPAHPCGEVRAGVGEGVVIDQLGGLVVAGVAVTAAAVGVAAGDRDVIVAGDALDPRVAQPRPQLVDLRAETAEVTQAEQPLAAAGAGIGDERPQRVGVGVGATAHRYPRTHAAVTRDDAC